MNKNYCSKCGKFTYLISINGQMVCPNCSFDEKDSNNWSEIEDYEGEK